MAAIVSLGGRGDAAAVPALEALLKSSDLSIEMVPMIKEQIARLQKPAAKPAAAGAEGGQSASENGAASEKNDGAGGVLAADRRLVDARRVHSRHAHGRLRRPGGNDHVVARRPRSHGLRPRRA